MKARLLGIPLLLVVMLSLGSCKQVQLGGPVVRASVEIDLLNQPGASYQSLSSSSSASAIATLGLVVWSEFNDAQRALWLGNFEVDEALVDPSQLYLVRASGGSDVDPEGDGSINLRPLEVSGSWHAVMPGRALLGFGNKVSALTEAAYQQVRADIGYLTDAELLQRLDAFARAVVSDANGDGRVDYDDVLVWSRSLSASSYLGDIALLDELAAAIVADAPGYVISAAAESVFRNQRVAPVEPPDAVPTALGGIVNGDLVLEQAGSPYLLTTGLTVVGSLRIGPGVVVRGRGKLIQVSGDLFIEGLPRQRVTLDDLGLDVISWGSGLTNLIRNADITDGRLGLHIQKLLVEGNKLVRVGLSISNSVQSTDSLATLRRNVIDSGTVRLVNDGPVRTDFVLRFENNLIVTRVGTLTTLVSSWQGPLENLVVRNNTFNANMLIKRSSSRAALDISSNYWGAGGLPQTTANMVIPENVDSGLLPVIPYKPILLMAHPDTPSSR